MSRRPGALDQLRQPKGGIYGTDRQWLQSALELPSCDWVLLVGGELRCPSPSQGADKYNRVILTPLELGGSTFDVVVTQSILESFGLVYDFPPGPDLGTWAFAALVRHKGMNALQWKAAIKDQVHAFNPKNEDYNSVRLHDVPLSPTHGQLAKDGCQALLQDP
jgi:hypothetical protein